MVLLCSIDGCRPDGIALSHTPCISSLCCHGAYTLAARTVMPCCTLPCHTSMFRGVPPERHGITTNTFSPLVRPVPSLLDAAHRQGLRTGMFYNWGQLRDLAEPDSVDVSVLLNTTKTPDADERVALACLNEHRSSPFDLMFLYLGRTDQTGHDHGWMSSPYIGAISEADRCLEMVVSALRPEDYVVVLSDHGGHDRTHGQDIPEDMTIPFVAMGPGITARKITEPVRIDQTAPTVAALLGIAAPPEWDAQAVQLS